MRNEQILSKADIALSNLAADGGLLPAVVASNFIQRLIKTPTLLAQARVVEMPSAQYKIPRIRFDSRIIRKGVQGTALTQGQRSKPTTSEIELNAKEIIASVFIPYDVMEEAVEQANLNLTDAQRQANNGNAPADGIRDTIVKLMAERAATDIEELGLWASPDYASSPTDADEDDLFQLFEGYMYIADDRGNVVDNEGDPVSLDLFKAGLKALPDPYHRNKVAMRHYVSVNTEINYRSTLATRETGLGDGIINGMQPVMGYGVPVEALHHMTDDKGLLTNPKNLIYGIRRKVNLEFDKNIHTRTYEIVLTMRLDVEVEEEEAIVEYTEILTD